MFTSHSPILMNIKRRAPRRTELRTTLHSYYDFTAESRPLNMATRVGISNPKKPISNLSLKKLVERSKDLRLTRISTRQNPRPTGLSTTNHHLSTRLGYNSSIALPTMKKLPTENIPNIHQHSNRTQTTIRPPLTKQQKIPIPVVHSEHQSLLKLKSSISKAHQPTILRNKSPLIATNTQPEQISCTDYFRELNKIIIHWDESEEDEENVPLVIDKEFQEYAQKAIVKCADWLMKYVFDKKYDE